jgi:hypothetical protein
MLTGAAAAATAAMALNRPDIETLPEHGGSD